MPQSLPPSGDRKRFGDDVRSRSMVPLWDIQGQIFTPEPTTRVRACIWRWTEARPLLLRAAELVTAQEAERRVLVLANPGLDGRPSATQTLMANFQVILPGEVARAHRHSAAALRFIVEGEGGYTSMDGERSAMRRGDFLLTPNWVWHDHGSDGQEPVIWLDGLDLPVVQALNQIFFENYGEERFPATRPTDGAFHVWGSGLRPRSVPYDKPHSPIVNYRWERTHAALQTLAGQPEADPHDDVILEYVNPVTGRPALPTISAFIQMLRPGRELEAHRHTSSVVYLAVEGEGVTEIDGQELAWRENDVFVVPTWARHRHVNASSTRPAILFSESDEVILRSLGLYRERRG